MFELADSGSSGGLSLRLSVYLSLSLYLFRPPPVLTSRCVSLLRYLSTCYATPCHAALAQVCATA